MVSTRQKLSSVLAIGIALLIAACSSLRTVEMSPDQLHQQIRAGEFITSGDRVLVVTADEQRREISVTGIDETSVHGTEFVRGERSARGDRPLEHQAVSIPIDDIVAMKTREFSVGKTAVLVGSSYWIGMAIAAAMTVGALSAGP